jgi:Spy/CpxP family protein refolding chaperone
MKSFRFRLLIATLAIVLGSAIAKSQTAADAPPSPPMHGHAFGAEGHGFGFLAKSLNLTDDQQAQMKTIMEKTHTTLKPMMQQSHQLEQQIHQYAMTAPGSFDEKAVRSLATQKAQIDIELAVAQTKVHNQLFQLLTPDQQAKAKQLMADHEARMQSHMNQAPPNQAPPAPEQ